MTENGQSTGESGRAFICPEETRDWDVWIDVSGIVPKLRVEGRVRVGSNPARLTEGERIEGPEGVTQYLNLEFFEGATTKPDPNWMLVQAPDITPPHPGDSGRYYKSVIVVCDRRVYHRADDPQPRDGRSGTSSESRDGAASSIPCPFRDGGARSWEAWLNAMPGPDPKRLIVIGEVHTEAGYAGKLTLTHMDKMRPPNQYAELTLVESPGAPGGWQPIRAEQKTDQDEFTSVVIHCHDEMLVTISPVPVAV